MLRCQRNYPISPSLSLNHMEKTEKDNLRAYLMGIVSNLPECPGCYQYLDDSGTIIYVGKAKNLRRRVYSYFSKEHDNRKTAILVSKIRDIKYIVVDQQAFRHVFRSL